MPIWPPFRQHDACHAFGHRAAFDRRLFPYGIHTRYREIARGQIRGETQGRLKLLFHRETGEVLGVHIVGEGASELIHIGQAVMALGGDVDYFVSSVFNYPTLAECYKVAALAGRTRVAGASVRSPTVFCSRGNALRLPGRQCPRSASARTAEIGSGQECRV